MSRMEPFLTDQDRTPVYGSGTSTIKPEFIYSSHTVSHTLFVDESFWQLNTLRLQNEAGDTLISRPFTAEDDGEVFWKINLLINKDVAPWLPNNFEVRLHLESRPTGMPVFVYARLNRELRGPALPLQVPFETYTSMDSPSPRDFLKLTHLDPPFEGARIDLTYLKVLQHGPGKSLPQPLRHSPVALSLTERRYCRRPKPKKAAAAKPIAAQKVPPKKK